MNRYVAGLLFDEEGRHLAVIRKRRPGWQAGRLNVPGGKIETGETPLDAMHREFAEETGVFGVDWRVVAVLTGPDFEVHFFASKSGAMWRVDSQTDEIVFTAPVSQLLGDPALIPNLRVIIPLALDRSGIVKPVALQDARAAA